MDVAGRLAGADHVVQGRLMMARPVRTAGEMSLGQPDTIKPVADRFDVPRLAAMRCAGDGEFRVAQTESVRRTGLDQWQGLQRLDGGARVDGRIDIAPLQRYLRRRIDDGDATAMHAFHHVAARDLY